MLGPSALTILPLTGIPEIQPGDDLVALLADGAAGVQDGDILVVTSKIVSKAEGRIIAANDRAAAIRSETVRVVAVSADGQVQIVESRLGIIAAAAGVDASNTPEGTVLLLPEDPDASARSLAAGLRSATGKQVGVIVSDTLGRAWREGQTDAAIGAAGVRVFDDHRGRFDSAGRPLAVTLPCVADELAAAADLVKRKTTGIPVAIVRGRADLVGSLDLPGARSIVRPADRDLFATGSRESWEAGYAAGLAEVPFASAQQR